ncbi:MAG: hypothetical protein CMJ83_13545 [Planctomycetes bacterium]|nr:hypothetical protein [Planctomycetota bacterium]
MGRLRIGRKGAEEESPESGGGSGMKSLVIMLIVLDLLAGGFYGYLVLVKGKDVQGKRSSAERSLVRMKEMGEAVSLHARRLKKENTASVKEPRNPITKAAIDLHVEANIIINNPVRRTWTDDPRYDAWMVTVTFREKAGYRFKELVRFLKHIELQSPKVQISKINFGKRDPAEDWWRPTNMEVRIFKPRKRGER